MRILVVAPSDVGGGAEWVARTLAQGYRATGHDAWLVVGHKRGNGDHVVELPRHTARGTWARHFYEQAERTDEPRLARTLDLAGRVGEPLRVLRKQLGHEDMAFPGSHVLLEWARDVDVIHLHNLHGDYFDLRILPALSRTTRVVITLHDEWLLTGHCAATLDCTRWEHGCGSCPDLARYPSLHRDGTAHNAERKGHLLSRSRLAVTCPGAWLLARARASHLSAGATAFHHVTHGVDHGLFHAGDRAAARAELGIPADARVVAFDVTGSRGFRRPDWARTAVSRVEKPCTVLELGRASSPFARAPPHVDVRALGHLDARGVATALRAADVYLHPTVTDVHPTAVLEALACGTYVIGTGVPGVRELVAPPHGACVEPGADAMAAALSTWMTGSRGTAGEAPRVASVEDMVAGYLRVLEDSGPLTPRR